MTNSASNSQDPFTTLSSRRVHENDFYAIDHEEYIQPNGSQGNYFALTIPDSCIIAPYSNGTFIMIRQFRYLLDDWSIEFPAGGYKEGEDPMKGALRELKEETGVATDALEQIGEFFPYNGITREKCHVYYTGDFEWKDQNTDGDERIEVVQLTAEDIEESIADGRIHDGMTMAAWHIVKKHHVENTTIIV